jgi:hypothetical protein
MSETDDPTPSPSFEVKLHTTIEAFLTATSGAFSEDLAERLTCSEVEALAELHRVVGWDPQSVIDAHAASDEEGDAHYVDDEEDDGTFTMHNGRVIRRET